MFPVGAAAGAARCGQYYAMAERRKRVLDAAQDAQTFIALGKAMVRELFLLQRQEYVLAAFCYRTESAHHLLEVKWVLGARW